MLSPTLDLCCQCTCKDMSKYSNAHLRKCLNDAMHICPQRLPLISQIYADKASNLKLEQHPSSRARAHIGFFKNTSVVVSTF